jgi:putative ABC transport system permease protein
MSPKFAEIVSRISQAPGVVHAAIIAGGMPLSGSMSTTDITVPGRKVDNPDGVSNRRVSTDYHRVMKIPLKQGRLFEASDREGSQNVVIISEMTAKKYFPGEDALGKTVKLNDLDRTIVGVVGDVHQVSLETAPITEVYAPIGQQRTLSGELVVHTSGNPYDVLPAVKAAILQSLPDVPVRNVRTLEELYSRRVAQRRLNMLLLGLFGILGLVISAVGIYGVLAYVVSQRTREIGLRMALGATRSKVVAMVMRSAGLLVAIGLLIGGAGAWMLSRTAEKFLFRLDARDPRAFGLAILSLVVAALIASAIPARRAASVDPMDALRGE